MCFHRLRIKLLSKRFSDQVKPIEPLAPKPIEAKPAAVVGTKQLTNISKLATQDIPQAIIAHTASGITGVESGTGSNIPQVNGGMEHHQLITEIRL
jgi:hypothetical protein